MPYKLVSVCSTPPFLKRKVETRTQASVSPQVKCHARGGNLAKAPQRPQWAGSHEWQGQLSDPAARPPLGGPQGFPPRCGPRGPPEGAVAPVRGCGGAVRTLPRLLGRRPVPASSAGKQTWPARETRRTLRTTWETTCRSSLVTSRGWYPAAGRGEARALSDAAGLGRRAGGGTEACRGAPERRKHVRPLARDRVRAHLSHAGSPQAVGEGF